MSARTNALDMALWLVNWATRGNAFILYFQHRQDAIVALKKLRNLVGHGQSKADSEQADG